MKIRIIITLLVAGWAGVAETYAQTTVVGAPVGYNIVTALANSDTRFSVPLHQPEVFQGQVLSVSGSSVTVQGTTGWTANQFVYVSGTQSNTYYVTFRSGARMGAYYTVKANTSNALTVDLSGDTLQGVVAQGDNLAVIPYWTFATLFPNPTQLGITAMTSPAGVGAGTKFLFCNLSDAGVNLSTPAVYFYYSGTAAGGPDWRQIGKGPAKQNDQVVLPDEYMIIRQDQVDNDLNLGVAGTVPMESRGIVLGTIAPNVQQDNAVAPDVAVPFTLSQSGLFQAGAFAGTTSPAGTGSSGDRLLVYDDTVAAENKSPSAVYFYYTGTSGGGPSWRQSGSGTANMNDQTVFNPGSGFIVRKAAAATPSSIIWKLSPFYVNP